MMDIDRDYFGFGAFAHRGGCTQSRWDVDMITEDQDREPRGEHRCVMDDCPHQENRHTRTDVRLYCRMCGAAYTLSGEVRYTDTLRLGFGLPPVRHGGLWLYPGGELLRGEGPYQYLVARTKTDHLQYNDVIGLVHTSVGPRGAAQFRAAARPKPAGRLFPAYTVHFDVTRNGFKTLTAAARWITAQDTAAAHEADALEAAP